MEIRVLRYFLAVAREETISGAAEALHVTQPTLSRQLMDLEKELGKKLLILSLIHISYLCVSFPFHSSNFIFFPLNYFALFSY